MANTLSHWSGHSYETWLKTTKYRKSVYSKLIWYVEEKLPALLRVCGEDRFMYDYFEAMLAKLDELDKQVDDGVVDETKLKQHLQIADRRIDTLVARNVSNQTFNKRIELALKAQEKLGIDGKQYLPAIESHVSSAN